MKEKNTEFHSEETLDRTPSNRTYQHNVEDGTMNTTQEPDKEQLKWFFGCIATAMRGITEAERYSLINPRCDKELHNQLCWQDIAMRRTVSTILQKINEDNTKKPSCFGTSMFNPINGKTEPVLFYGDIVKDVPRDLNNMPDNDEQRERLLHDAQQEAVNWLIEHKTGQAPALESEKYLQQFAREMELDSKNIIFNELKGNDDMEKGKVNDAWMCESIANALRCITEEERNILIYPSCNMGDYKFLCLEYVAICLTVSAILLEINKDAKEKPTVIDTQLFNPFNGKTEMTRLCGDMEKDDILGKMPMPENAEQAEQMFHDARREAANWLTDKMLEELPRKSIDECA